MGNLQTVKFQASEEIIWGDSLRWRLLKWHYIVATCSLSCKAGAMPMEPKQWRIVATSVFFYAHCSVVSVCLASGDCYLHLAYCIWLCGHFIMLPFNPFGNPLNFVLPSVWAGQFKQGGSLTTMWSIHLFIESNTVFDYNKVAYYTRKVRNISLQDAVLRLFLWCCIHLWAPQWSVSLGIRPQRTERL